MAPQATAKTMHLHEFRAWVAAAPAQARADAATAIVAAYGHVAADPVRRERLDGMAALLLDDAAILVRRAMAQAVACSPAVPAWIATALAQDDSPVSAPVLAGSQLLSAADLVEAVACGDCDAQIAVASRQDLADCVAAALADTGHREAVLTLCSRAGATIEPAILRWVLRRFRDDADMREALLPHAHRCPALHHDLMQASAEALTRFAVACDWMSESRAALVRRESHDRGVVAIARLQGAAPEAAGLQRLVMHLRREGRLTPALLLRALLSGHVPLAATAFADLSGVAACRVEGQIRSPLGLGFASLYARAQLPPTLLPVFRAALRAIKGCDAASGLSRAAVSEVLRACDAAQAPELGRVTALLRRLEAEALRDRLRDEADTQPWGDMPAPHPEATNRARLRSEPSMQALSLRAA